METKRAVDQLSNFLNRANYNTISIHGDKQQFQRLVIKIRKFYKSYLLKFICRQLYKSFLREKFQF